MLKSTVAGLLKGTPLYGPAREVWRGLKARGLTGWTPLVPEADFSQCVRDSFVRLRERGGPVGDYLEFGVSRGTSLACTFRVLNELGLDDVRLFGFDSFEGLPPGAAAEGWVPGSFASTPAATRRYLAAGGVDLARVTLVEGWFSETLTAATRERLGLSRAGVAMLDCDTYAATREALWFCEPLIVDQTVLIFDDWGWQADKGEIGQREAFAEFRAAFPALTAQPLPAYIPQSRVFLVSRQPATGTSPLA